MKIDITLEEALSRASIRLQKKLSYSVELLQKAAPIATAYDSRGGISLPFPAEKTVRPSTMWPSWPVCLLRGT